MFAGAESDAGASSCSNRPSVSSPPCSLILYSVAFFKLSSNYFICVSVLAICSSKFDFNLVGSMIIKVNSFLYL